MKQIEKFGFAVRIVDTIDLYVLVLADTAEEAEDVARKKWPKAKEITVDDFYFNDVYSA